MNTDDLWEEKTKISKKAILLFFLFFTTLLYTQTIDTEIPEVNASRSEESSILFSESENNNEQQSTNDTNSIWLFIRMVLVLILVIVCIYGVIWFLKKTTNPKQDTDMYLKKTASLSLSPGKSVQVITIQDKAFVLGVTDNNISLISEITDKELIDAMNLSADKNFGKRTTDFTSLLNALTGSTKRTEEFVRNQRKKFSKNGENK